MVGSQLSDRGSADSAETEVLLDIHTVSKTFLGVKALDEASLTVHRGAVTALVGHNGSGKSTLIKILSGYHRPDPGSSAQLFGQTLDLAHIDATMRSRIRIMHQDLGLVPGMSLAENLALGRGFHTGRLGRIRWREEVRQARSAMADLGLDLDPTINVSEIDPASRAIVSLARVVQGAVEDQGILVLDEPTASLESRDVERVTDAIGALTARGWGVVFVSHRLGEVFKIADYVTVLRDGHTMANDRASSMTEDSLVKLMIGEKDEPSGTSMPTRAPEGGQPAVAIDGLWGRTLKNLSVSFARGEVVGLAGLVGSGREELGSLVVGLADRMAGTVRIDGEELAGSPRTALDRGVALVAADRHGSLLFPKRSVAFNVCVGAVHSLAQRLWLSSSRESTVARTWLDRLDVKPADPNAIVGTFSGGNQQKVVLARFLSREVRVLMLEEPTQGVDVGAKSAIYRIIEDVAAAGCTVVVSSGDTEELCRICDRVLVIHDGELVDVLEGEALSEEALVGKIIGNASAVART